MTMGTTWNLLVSDEELDAIAKKRRVDYVEEKVNKELVDSRINQGWSLKKSLKSGSAVLTKQKRIGNSFEDQIWTILYRMGFKIMNRTNAFELCYSENDPKLTKQIDVIAIDDETCLFIECKETARMNNSKSWLMEIAEMDSKYKGCIDEISSKYPGLKFKQIFATKNYILGDQDLARLKDAKITHFSNEMVDYYEALVEHLGPAAKYQLLGSLFAGQEIKGLEERIPAIEGKMGNLTYYSFSIEPERLLKISYVLHRNHANRDMMPTYQRLIKKNRLTQIRDFVNNGGYFPNSLIISIDDPKQRIRFEPAPQVIKNSVSKIGTLYLPKQYQSAYIIDGQHRLYGYSESRFAKTNSVPVVAFVNMSQERQVEIFMEINENQKAVSKSLRNTLIINMDFCSNNLNKRRQAVMLDIAQKLGEKPESPLYGRVITGENTKTLMRCITIEYLKSALEKTNIFNKYKNNNEVLVQGILDRTDGQKTVDAVFPFFVRALNLLAKECREEWDKGSAGTLTINNTIVGVIRIIGDIVDLVIEGNGLPQVIYDIDRLFEKCEPWLVDFADAINKMSPERRNEIKNEKGGAAKEQTWRKLQLEFNRLYPDFTNPDLVNYIENKCTDYKSETEELALVIRASLVKTIRAIVENQIGGTREMFPEDLDISLQTQIARQNTINSRNGVYEEIDQWSFIGFDELAKIISHKDHWTKCFKIAIIGLKANKAKTEIISSLISMAKISKKIKSSSRISKDELDFIKLEYDYWTGNNSEEENF